MLSAAPVIGNGPLDQGSYADLYDRWILSDRARAIHGDAGFYNVGDWTGDTNLESGSLQAAAQRLLRRHCAADPEPDAARAVLDVGCGLGATTATLHQHYPGALLVGLNISREQIAVAADNAPGARFVAADAATLPFAGASFDRIHCVEAAFHFDTRQAFLKEAFRVLRPGGLCVLSDLLLKGRLSAVATPADNVCATIKEYRRRCGAAGFDVERSDEIGAVTLWPFCDHLERHGERAMALALRRNAVGYVLAALRKPQGTP